MSEKKYPIGGYAPGNYTCKCCVCGQQFQGDKRAVQCEVCAVKGLTPEMQLIYNIVEQWGNAIEMPNMEQWLKDYAKQRCADIERIELGLKDGLPEHEASFQSGYSSGHETGYERGKREAKPGAVWPLYIVNKNTGVKHEVNKFIYNPADPSTGHEVHVWCHSWYGHHIIGQDCEWATKDESPAEQPVREAAIAFAEWLNSNFVSIENKDGEAVYVEYSPQEYDKKQQFKIAQLWEVFKNKP